MENDYNSPEKDINTPSIYKVVDYECMYLDMSNCSSKVAADEALKYHLDCCSYALDNEYIPSLRKNNIGQILSGFIYTIHKTYNNKSISIKISSNFTTGRTHLKHHTYVKDGHFSFQLYIEL
jgi:hypothetical protein